MSQQKTSQVNEKPSVVWFDNSPDCGPDCICSVCRKPILEEEGPALRFYDARKKIEARFHLRCAKRLKLQGPLVALL